MRISITASLLSIRAGIHTPSFCGSQFVLVFLILVTGIFHLISSYIWKTITKPQSLEFHPCFPTGCRSPRIWAIYCIPLAGSRIRRGTARISTSACVGCQQYRRQFSPLSHNVNPELIYLRKVHCTVQALVAVVKTPLRMLAPHTRTPGQVSSLCSCWFAS